MTDDKKFIESYPVTDYEVWTDEGWVDIIGTNKTIEYDVYEIVTENHSLKCADNHIVFNKDMLETFAINLNTNDFIHTDKGIEQVISVTNLNYKENMYDLSLDIKSNKRYYTNGILSHNTTIMTIYALWLTCFSDDKTVLIVANKEKTAINILKRIRMAYEQLPNWLKPGVKKWGDKEVIFGNDSRITISSTSSSSSRGDTVNCVDGNSIVTLKSKESGEIFDISMKDLSDILEADGEILDMTLIDDQLNIIDEFIEFE